LEWSGIFLKKKMLYKNRKEINYEMYYEQTLDNVLINRMKRTSISIYKKTPKVKLCFNYMKVTEENLARISLYNNVILNWLLFDSRKRILHKTKMFIKGSNFYDIQYEITITSAKEFFKFINVFTNTLIPIMPKDAWDISINNGTSIIKINDLDMFTNIRLSQNLYLNSIHETWMIIMDDYINNHQLMFYLNSLKLL